MSEFDKLARAEAQDLMREVEVLRRASTNLLALCERHGFADSILASLFPDAKNRSGDRIGEAAKEIRRSMNELRAALRAKAGQP